MDPYGQEAALKALADAGIAAFAMELMPRITRAQVDGRALEPGQPRRLPGGDRRRRRIWPRLADDDDRGRHRAGGPGLRHGRRRRRPAGDRHRAPARRDRDRDRRAPAAKEQVESLGAKFVAVEDEEFKQAETAGGYAKEMSTEYQAKQAALVAEHIAKQDIVITTALIPGRPAPRLVTKDMVESMKPGSVIVDLAVERGGNCERREARRGGDHERRQDRRPSQRAGPRSPRRLGLYARNLYAFVETLVDKETKALAVKWDDEIVKATVPHPRRRGRSSELCSQERGLSRGAVDGDYRPDQELVRAWPLRAADAALPRRDVMLAAARHHRGRERRRDARRHRRRGRSLRVPPRRSSCWRSSSAITWSGR